MFKYSGTGKKKSLNPQNQINSPQKVKCPPINPHRGHKRQNFSVAPRSSRGNPITASMNTTSMNHNNVVALNK